jgi:hypothetical protein
VSESEFGSLRNNANKSDSLAVDSPFDRNEGRLKQFSDRGASLDIHLRAAKIGSTFIPRRQRDLLRRRS